MIKFIDGTTRIGKSSLIQAMTDINGRQEVIDSNYDFLKSTCSNTDAIFTTFINFISRMDILNDNIQGDYIVDRSIINDAIYVIMYSLANRVMLEHGSVSRIEFGKLVDILDKYPNYYTPLIKILKLLIEPNKESYKFLLIESPMYDYNSYKLNIMDKVEFHYIPLFKRFKGLPLRSEYCTSDIIDEVEELNRFYNYMYRKIMDDLKIQSTVITTDNYKNYLM